MMCITSNLSLHIQIECSCDIFPFFTLSDRISAALQSLFEYSLFLYLYINLNDVNRRKPPSSEYSNPACMNKELCGGQTIEGIRR